LSGDELLLIAARQILVSIAVQTGEANDKLSLLIAIRLDKSVVAVTGLPEL
jgi:hypothetical protein